MFENYYSFFHYCLLSCRYAILQKSILNESNWGAQAVVRGDGAPGLTVATALATSQGRIRGGHWAMPPPLGRQDLH